MEQVVPKFYWWEYYDYADWFFLKMTSVWFARSIKVASDVVVVVST